MKRIARVLLVVFLLGAFSTTGFASILKKDVSIFRGTVLSVNAKLSQLKLKDRKSGKEMTFNYKGGLGSNIGTGSTVIVIRDNPNNIVKSIRLVNK